MAEVKHVIKEQLAYGEGFDTLVKNIVSEALARAMDLKIREYEQECTRINNHMNNEMNLLRAREDFEAFKNYEAPSFPPAPSPDDILEYSQKVHDILVERVLEVRKKLRED